MPEGRPNLITRWFEAFVDLVIRPQAIAARRCEDLSAIVGRFVRFDEQIAQLEARFLQLQQQGESRETLLRDEIEKWKSHRAWSDRIVAAYLDELARHDPPPTAQRFDVTVTSINQGSC